MTEPALVAASTPSGATWQVPAGWEQGRGAWGGLVVAGLIRATQTHVTDPDRTLRSVTCQLLAPLPSGLATIHSAVLRGGSATVGIRADAHDEAGKLCATLTAVWGTDRASEVQPPYLMWGANTAPEVPGWAETPIVAIEPPLGPAFGAHLVFRPVVGYPTSGSNQVAGWIGLPDATESWHWDVASLVAMVDAWWPAALSRLDTMRPMATISFAAHVMCDPGDIAGTAPLLHEGTLVGANSGFSSEIRRLWTPDGQLAIDSFQLIAVIR